MACTVACTVRALYVHCKTRCLCPLLFSAAERCNFASGGAEAHSTLVHHARHTASDPQFLPTYGANAAMLHLCLWVAAVKMKVCLDWVLARANGNLFKLALQSHKPKKINFVLLCLLGRSFEDESVFGLRFWQMQKGVCSSFCLHIHKPKNLPWVLQKKQPSSDMLSHHT